MSSDLSERCFFCGVSTVGGPRCRLRSPVQSYLLTEEFIVNHPNIFISARQRCDGRQITVHDRICGPCFQLADSPMKREDQKEREAGLAVKVEVQEEPSTSQPSECDPLALRREDLVDVSPENDTPSKPYVPIIPIPGFQRMPSNTTNCIKVDCGLRINLHTISLEIRTKILLKQNIYIPRRIRVCAEHSEDEALWNDLKAHGRSTIDTFNGAQVADMLQMLQNNNFKKPKRKYTRKP